MNAFFLQSLGGEGEAMGKRERSEITVMYREREREREREEQSAREREQKTAQQSVNNLKSLYVERKDGQCVCVCVCVCVCDVVREDVLMDVSMCLHTVLVYRR